MILFVLFALLIHGGSLLLSARAGGIRLEALSVYFDGHLYLEIARSFPLPYSAQGIAYTGLAPGFPALIYAIHLLGLGVLSWGAASLLATWLSSGFAAGAFYTLCRELRIDPLWPGVLFVVANARWLSITGAAHPEGLAMGCALLAFAWVRRGRLDLAVLFLTLAGLTRFPAFLLGVPLAYEALVQQRRLDVKSLALLTTPVLAFGLFVLYLHARIPDYPGIAAAHEVFWQTGPYWPFLELYRAATAPEMWAQTYPHRGLTFAWLGIYLAALVIGLRPAARDARFLSVWITVVVLFHVSLRGLPGAWDFERLAILAWPAALLILWPALLVRIPVPALATAAALLLAFNLWVQARRAEGVVPWQLQIYPFLRERAVRLDDDEPRWFDFAAPARAARPALSR